MVRMAKKVKVKKEKKPVTQASGTETIIEKKPRRVRAPEKVPTTKAEFTVKAGRVQAKLNAITANRDKAFTTASNRVNAKYRAMVTEELQGLHEGVIERLVLPEFAVDNALEDLVEGEEFVEIGTDLNEALNEEAAQ
jgi:hypothetical protein